jgi:hypothetical protein
MNSSKDGHHCSLVFTLIRNNLMDQQNKATWKNPKKPSEQF